MCTFELTNPKVSIYLRFLMQKKGFSFFSQWIVLFSSVVHAGKLFRNCLTNQRFSGRLFKFFIVYKKKMYSSTTRNLKQSSIFAARALLVLVLGRVILVLYRVIRVLSCILLLLSSFVSCRTRVVSCFTRVVLARLVTRVISCYVVLYSCRVVLARVVTRVVFQTMSLQTAKSLKSSCRRIGETILQQLLAKPSNNCSVTGSVL